MTDKYAALRTFLEREIDRAQHPSGMSVHDGRVHTDASVIQRLLAIIEKLSAERDALREALTVARDYVAADLDWLREAYKGYETAGHVPETEGDLASIDAALAMGEGNE